MRRGRGERRRRFASLRSRRPRGRRRAESKRALGPASYTLTTLAPTSSLRRTATCIDDSEPRVSPVVAGSRNDSAPGRDGGRRRGGEERWRERGEGGSGDQKRAAGEEGEETMRGGR